MRGGESEDDPLEELLFRDPRTILSSLLEESPDFLGGALRGSSSESELDEEELLPDALAHALALTGLDGVGDFFFTSFSELDDFLLGEIILTSRSELDDLLLGDFILTSRSELADFLFSLSELLLELERLTLPFFNDGGGGSGLLETFLDFLICFSLEGL